VKVAYTRKARQLIERIGRWWVTNREAAPDLFFAELDAAIELLETSPEVGSPYRTKQGDVVRRILLPRTNYHVYYRIELELDLVLVISVWSTHRGRGPSLR
jgi:plasmid stabilization system protein ParE